MKRRCVESARVQDFLEHELDATGAEQFRRHLAGCESCAAEVAAYQRLFGVLEQVPLLESRPALTDRILDAVLPSRIRRRWLRTFGWTYAGSLAATMAAAVGIANLPGAHTWFDTASATASRHSVQLVVFFLNLLGMATLGLANSWGALARLASRIAPLTHALGALLQRPPIEAALWAAAVICVAVLWLLRGRERTSSRRIDPFGILGV